VWAFVAVAVAVLALVAWRWMPRPQPPASVAMRAAMSALASSHATETPRPEPAAHPASDRQRLMAAAFAMEGIPYRYSGKGRDALDCSGFTKLAYATVGIELPDGSFNQSVREQALVDAGALVPGDLWFYRWAGSERITHVTMYAGDGWLIGTGTPGEPTHVVVYPLAHDLRADGRVITFRHIVLNDEH
jgi:cell wall-associated NlpC family hydrolase